MPGSPFRRDSRAVDLRTRDESAVLEDIEHVIFVCVAPEEGMPGRAVYCKTAKFPAAGNRFGRRGCPWPHNIIPRSRSSRGSAAYRHRGRVRLRGDRREVEAGRRSGSGMT